MFRHLRENLVDGQYSFDGGVFAAASQESVTVWDTRVSSSDGMWNVQNTLPHATVVHAIAWHPSTNQLLTACHDGAHHWNIDTGQLLGTVEAGQVVLSVLWLAHGTRIVCGTSSNRVSIHVPPPTQ
jgi:WD40 repeat protein